MSSSSSTQPATRVREPGSLDPFRIYWNAYGGWRELFTSPYLLAALVLTAMCYPVWSEIKEGQTGYENAQLGIDVIPSLLAFSLGAMAIVLAFSGGKFLKAIREDGDEKSFFMTIVATFFHFIFVQALALATAMVAMAFPKLVVPAAVSFFFLSYSLMAAVAAAAALLNASRIYNKVGSDDEPA